MKNLLLSLIALTVFSTAVNAQIRFYEQENVQESIFDELKLQDPKTHASIIVHQDTTITRITEKHESCEMRGFRIQVFSSNQGMAAKQQAYDIRGILTKRHSGIEKDVYVTYEAPFWKVRLGNCMTQTKAQELKEWVNKEYPQLINETYIVPSIILIR